MNGRRIAKSLAWFGIGLGFAELLAPREIASGALVLAADEPERALWVRVAGDGLDGAVLASGLSSSNPNRTRTLLATLAVAPVVALDALYARRLGA